MITLKERYIYFKLYYHITPIVFNRPSVFEVFLQSVTYSLSLDVLFYSLIFKVLAPRLIQSIYCKVCGCVFHVCVPSNGTQNFIDWSLLVKDKECQYRHQKEMQTW